MTQSRTGFSRIKIEIFLWNIFATLKFASFVIKNLIVLSSLFKIIKINNWIQQLSGLDRNVFQSINFFMSQKFSFEWMYISILMCFNI